MSLMKFSLFTNYSFSQIQLSISDKYYVMFGPQWTPLECSCKQNSNTTRWSPIQVCTYKPISAHANGDPRSKNK